MFEVRVFEKSTGKFIAGTSSEIEQDVIDWVTKISNEDLIVGRKREDCEIGDIINLDLLPEAIALKSKLAKKELRVKRLKKAYSDLKKKDNSENQNDKETIKDLIAQLLEDHFDDSDLD